MRGLYWGLRKYAGNQDLVWDGKLECQHEWKNYKRPPGGGHPSASAQVGATKADVQRIFDGQGSWCSLCGAWRGALGLEPTVELYVQHIVEICREVKRVLRSDGTFWINIGDSYFGGGNNRGNNSPISDKQASNFGAVGQCAEHQKNIGKHPTLKPKDLCLIPERLALALQMDGWWVRSRIAWVKPDPMPESVQDRPTDSWEHIWMLTKSAKYYYDSFAVREVGATPEGDKAGHRFGGNKNNEPNSMTCHSNEPGKKWEWTSHRNLRSAWTFPTQPYKAAHFAVFPEALPERCIKASTSEKGCCPKCGKPWIRIIGGKSSAFNIRVRDAKAGRVTPEEGYKATQTEMDNYQGNHPDPRYRQTLGWKPGCECNAGDSIACTVLDCFCGSGTTLAVAKRLGRTGVGYELSTSYCELAKKRIEAETACFPNFVGGGQILSISFGFLPSLM